MKLSDIDTMTKKQTLGLMEDLYSINAHTPFQARQLNRYKKRCEKRLIGNHRPIDRRAVI